VRKVKKNSRRISLEILKLLGDQTRRVACYAAICKEVDLNFLLREDGPHLFLLPRISRGRRLEMVPVDSSTPLESGPFGISSPPSEIPALEPGEIDVVLVPGLCFDRYGNRLGTGGGYYDRYLAEFDGLRIGVCFGSQISLQKIPSLDHDIPMQFIVHENGVIKTRYASCQT